MMIPFRLFTEKVLRKSKFMGKNVSSFLGNNQTIYIPNIARRDKFVDVLNHYSKVLSEGFTLLKEYNFKSSSNHLSIASIDDIKDLLNSLNKLKSSKILSKKDKDRVDTIISSIPLRAINSLLKSSSSRETYLTHAYKIIDNFNNDFNLILRGNPRTFNFSTFSFVDLKSEGKNILNPIQGNLFYSPVSRVFLDYIPKENGNNFYKSSKSLVNQDIEIRVERSLSTLKINTIEFNGYNVQHEILQIFRIFNLSNFFFPNNESFNIFSKLSNHPKEILKGIESLFNELTKQYYTTILTATDIEILAEYIESIGLDNLLPYFKNYIPESKLPLTQLLNGIAILEKR